MRAKGDSAKVLTWKSIRGIERLTKEDVDYFFKDWDGEKPRNKFHAIAIYIDAFDDLDIRLRRYFDTYEWEEGMGCFEEHSEVCA